MSRILIKLSFVAFAIAVSGDLRVRGSNRRIQRMESYSSLGYLEAFQDRIKLSRDVSVQMWKKNCGFPARWSYRPVDVSKFFAHLSPGGHERAVWPEPLDSIVARIRDVDVTRRADSHTNRCAEFAWRCPAAAPALHQDVVQITAGEK